MITFLCLLVLLSTSSFATGKSTIEDYYVQTQLLNALKANPYAQFSIKDLFYPDTPVCNPIQFMLTCADDPDFSYNRTNLWTSYDANSYVGQILLSSSYYGIVLRGFDWESSCYTESKDEVVLELQLPECDVNITSDAWNRQLLAFTVTLKAYANSNSTPKGSDLSDDKAYAIEDWKEPDTQNKIFNTSYVILSMMVGFLDFFIFVFSIAICSAVYDAIYHEIKDKKNPYYPLYSATVLCTMIWNLGPGWFVLLFDTDHIKYSFVVLIPLQLVLAVLMKKYPDFPLPGLPCTKKTYTYLEEESSEPEGKSSKGHHVKSQSYFLWEICHMKYKGTIIASFIVQSIGVWSLLVFFTHVAYYSVGVTISLYLYPIETVVKVIFIKAVAVCVVFDVAILFSGKTWDYKCTTKGIISDVAMVFACLSLLPIIAFIAFVAGGVIFTSPSSKLSGLQGILVLVPSVILLLVGWYSKGTLFPEKLVADSSASQDLSDVEAAAANNSAGKGNTPTINGKTYGST